MYHLHISTIAQDLTLHTSDPSVEDKPNLDDADH